MRTIPKELDYGLVHGLSYDAQREVFEARVTLHEEGGTIDATYFVDIDAPRRTDLSDVKLRLVIEAARLHRLGQAWGTLGHAPHAA